MIPETIRILLVDDDEDDFLLTRDMLLGISRKRFKVDWASTYEMAQKRIAEAAHDIYLFDYRLGGHNGLDLLQETRKQGNRTPIILLTGQGDREVDLEAMKRGASDYLVKGSFDSPLLERSMRYAIEHGQTLAELQDSQEKLTEANRHLEEAARRITDELEMARFIQGSMLPESLDVMPGLRFAARYIPCETVGGDLYDLIPIDDQRVALVIFDVVGHGVPAALVTAMAKIAFARNIHGRTTPGDVLREVNREIVISLREQRNLTAFLGFLDKDKKEFLYSRAGHPPAILVSSAKGEVENLDIKGISIGFIPDADYENKTVQLSAGDKIVLYTDGLTENLNLNGERFGRNRLRYVLKEMLTFSAQEMVEKITKLYSEFIGKAVQADDISILVTEIL